MRIVAISLAAAALLFSSQSYAEVKEGAAFTVEGEIVDIGCYAARAAKGPDHRSCAQRCISNGNPAGVLDADGVVYTIAASAPAFERFAAETVRIQGSLVGTLLRIESMSVRRADDWEEVPLNSFGAPESE